MIYKIKDLATVKRGASPRPILDYLTSSGFKWLKISDFSFGDKYVFETKEFIKEEGVKKTRFVKKGTLILTNSGTPGIPIFLGEDMCLHDGFLYFENVNERVNLEFLFYWFQNYRNNIVNLANGSVFKNLKKEIVENLEIDLPDINEQNRIVNILSKIDSKILNNVYLNKSIKNYIDCLFTKNFVDNENTLNFKEGIFSDLISFSNGYSFDSKLMLDKEEKDTYKVFKMGNIMIGGGINKSKTKSWYKKDQCKNIEKFIAQKNDILMCMTDMKASENPLLGHTALIDKSDEFVINQRVGIIRCKKEIYVPFVYTLTNYPSFISEIRSRSNSGVQVNLSTSGICNTKVMIPSESLIFKFYNDTKELFYKQSSLFEQNEQLVLLKENILKKLFM